MTDFDADVIVVGAGFSGLTAALALWDSGKSVIVLEARDRVGGRSMAGELNGYSIDLGGQWVGPHHDRLKALADRYGVGTRPQYAQGRKIVDYRGKVSSYAGLVPSLPVVGLVEAQLMINRIDRMARRIPLDAPWDAADAAALDFETVESWKRRTVRTSAARAVLDMATRAIFTAEPADLSMLWFLFYCQAGGSFTALASVENGAQERVFEGGAYQIAARIADALAERVRLASPVTAIRQDGRGVTISCATGMLSARHAIVAVPPTLAGRIRYEPPLPSARDALFQRMAMGSVIKAYVAYPTAFWRKKGLSGEAISDASPFSPVFDASPSDGSFGALVGFFDGEAARVWTDRSREDRRDAVLGCLARYFGDEALTPLDYVEQDWIAENWTRGCYAAFAGPGTLTAYGPATRAACGHIHWAGTETAALSCGYLDGAVRSGERAAQEVAALLDEPQR